MLKFNFGFLISSLILSQISADRIAPLNKRSTHVPNSLAQVGSAEDTVAHVQNPTGQIVELNERSAHGQYPADQIEERFAHVQYPADQMEERFAQAPSGQVRTAGLIDKLSEGIAHGLSAGLSNGISSGITSGVYALPDAIAGTLNNLKNPNYGGSSYSSIGHISQSSFPESYSSFSSSPVYSSSISSYSPSISHISEAPYPASYESYSSGSSYSIPSYIQHKPASPPFHWDCKLVPAPYGHKLGGLFKSTTSENLDDMEGQVETLSQLIQNGDYSVRSSEEPMEDAGLSRSNQPMEVMEISRMDNQPMLRNNQPMGIIGSPRSGNQPMEVMEISLINNQPMGVMGISRMNNRPMGVMEISRMNHQPMGVNNQPMGVVEISRMNNQPMGVMEISRMNNEPMGVMEVSRMNNEPMGIMEILRNNQPMGNMESSSNQPMRVVEISRMTNQPIGVKESSSNQPMGFMDSPRSPVVAVFSPNTMDMQGSMLRDMEERKNLALLEEMNINLPPLGMVDPSKLVHPQELAPPPNANIMVLLVPMPGNQMSVQTQHQMQVQPHQMSAQPQTHQMPAKQKQHQVSTQPQPHHSEAAVSNAPRANEADNDERQNFIEPNGENR